MGARRSCASAAARLSLLALLGACRKTSTVDPPELKPITTFEDRLCHELHPCPVPTSPNEQPYMCAIPGAQRTTRPERVGDLDVEMLWCPYRKMGEDEIVGVPRDGSRPLVRGVQLLERVKGNARARAFVAGSVLVGWGTDERCAIEEHDGVLRFCVHHSSDGPFHCMLDAGGSVVCAREAVPDRFLAACQARHGRRRVVVVESTISPAAMIAPVDVFRGALDAGRFGPGDYAQLRAGGHDVRVLECSELDGPHEDVLVIDGDVPEAVDVKQLLPRLDGVGLRAALASQKIVRSPGNYVMLDATEVGRSSARARGCVPAPGPREVDGKLAFYTASTNGGPFQACTVDTSTWTGACFDVRPGKLCE